MNTYQANRYTQFITPLGGIIAFTCFFLPWVTRVDNFASFQFTRSGFQSLVPIRLGPNTVFNAIVFIASVVIVGVGIYMVIRRTPRKSKVPVLMSSGIGLAILLADQLKYIGINQVLDRSNYTIRLGFWGTVAGLIIAALGILLIRAEMEKARPKDSVEVKQLWFIVHAGGIIALFGIFMPWDEISSITGQAGFRLMSREPLIIFIFVASLIVLVGSFYTLASGNLRRLRVAVLVSIGIGLGILLAYSVDFYVGEIRTQNLLRRYNTETPKSSIGFGFYLTILGYVIAAVGMFLIKTRNRDPQVEIPAESG